MITIRLNVAALAAVVVFTAFGTVPHTHADEPDVVPPSAPTGLITTPTPPLKVHLTWTASDDNVGVEGYYVYRNGSQVTTVNTTSFDDTVPSAGFYSYTVTAFDAAGNVSLSSDADSVSITLDTTPPSAPTNLTATAAPTSTSSTTDIVLRWSPATDNVAVTRYIVYQDGIQVSTTTATSYSRGVTPNTYTYRVSAVDSSGNITPSGSVSITIVLDLLAPEVPIRLLGSGSVPGEARLTWTAPSDNIGVAGYYIYRDIERIGQTTSTSYTDRNLEERAHSYEVAAYDAAQNTSARTYPISVAVLAPASTTPTSTTASSTPTSTTQAAPATTTTTAPSTPVPPVAGNTFTLSLYVGVRNGQVKSLQTLLIAKGYLAADGGTGFFGKMTEAAIKKFQCEQKIACSGDGASTGWGLVGAKTRAALNALSAGGATSTAGTQSTATTQALQLQLLQLLQQLQMLQVQAGQR